MGEVVLYFFEYGCFVECEEGSFGFGEGLLEV